MNRLFFKILSMVVSAITASVAAKAFKKIWQLAAHEDDAPKASDADHGWKEVLLAAGVQGAIFAVVKAASDRGTRQATGQLQPQ